MDAAGVAHVGKEAIGKELAKYFSLGLQMSITPTSPVRGG